MKDIGPRALWIVAGMISILPQVVHSQCSYSYTSNYNRCNGMNCYWDSDCFSDYCLNGMCMNDNNLPPWAIVLIVFFVLLIFFSVISACRRKRQVARLRN